MTHYLFGRLWLTAAYIFLNLHIGRIKSWGTANVYVIGSKTLEKVREGIPYKWQQIQWMVNEKLMCVLTHQWMFSEKFVEVGDLWLALTGERRPVVIGGGPIWNWMSFKLGVNTEVRLQFRASPALVNVKSRLSSSINMLQARKKVKKSSVWMIAKYTIFCKRA